MDTYDVDADGWYRRLPAQTPQDASGSQMSLEPVSKITLNSCGGVPTLTRP